MTKYHVGQSIVVVKNRGHRSETIQPATITKIGRKWAEFETTEYWSQDRFELNTGLTESLGHGFPGRVYAGMDEYESYLLRENKELKIVRQLDPWSLKSRLQTLNEEQLLQVAELLGVELINDQSE